MDGNWVFLFRHFRWTCWFYVWLRAAAYEFDHALLQLSCSSQLCLVKNGLLSPISFLHGLSSCSVINFLGRLLEQLIYLELSAANYPAMLLIWLTFICACALFILLHWNPYDYIFLLNKCLLCRRSYLWYMGSVVSATNSKFSKLITPCVMCFSFSKCMLYK